VTVEFIEEIVDVPPKSGPSGRFNAKSACIANKAKSTGYLDEPEILNLQQ
jgi:hypothetical protein